MDVLRRALQEIAWRPAVERNPDGVDQAAHTMQMIAREALEEADRQHQGAVSRTWTLYVCPRCEKAGTKKALVCHCVGALEQVEVVEARPSTDTGAVS
jgi:hypothetical protein